MITQSAREVFERIERAARERPGGVVATDGDGTLWSGDVGDDLFEAFVDHGRVGALAHAGMVRAASSFGLDASGSAAALCRRIWAAFTAGELPEEPVFELIAWSFASWSRGEARAFAEDVIEKKALKSRMHAEVAHLLERVRAANIEIYLVSASPRAVNEAAGALLGVTPDRIVAATARFDGETMLADVERPIPYGPGKVAGLRARIGDRPLYAAFGDSAFDLTMLSYASVPVAVRPKPKLRARASELPQLVELAPEI